MIRYYFFPSFFIMLICKSLALERTFNLSMRLEIGNYVNSFVRYLYVGWFQFSPLLCPLLRCTSDKGGRETENTKALLNVVMAAFIVSLRTQLKLEVWYLFAVHIVQWKVSCSSYWTCHHYLTLIHHLPFQISVHLVGGVIDSPWIQSQELKYLLASLYNVGIVLYRNKELEKVEYLLFDFLYI